MTVIDAVQVRIEMRCFPHVQLNSMITSHVLFFFQFFQSIVSYYHPKLHATDILGLDYLGLRLPNLLSLCPPYCSCQIDSYPHLHPYSASRIDQPK
jgi:hypothetical protein